MKRKNMNREIRFGDLLAALYDEAGKVTKDKRIQGCLTYLALLDMQHRLVAR